MPNGAPAASGLGAPLKTPKSALKDTEVEGLTEFNTPLEKVFHVRHLGMPDVVNLTESWKLTISGLVGKELVLSLKDLQGMEQVELCAFHECAGSPLRPTTPARRVANVVWRGVRLADVLARAGGVRPEAKYLWSYGADHGEFNKVTTPTYLKDIPVEEPLERPQELLLATHINGEPLPPERGGPLRLVVPGFYGTNSTKWLARLEAHEIRAPGYFTTVLYNERVRQVVPAGAPAGHFTILPENPSDPSPGEKKHDGDSSADAPPVIARPIWRVAPHAIIVTPGEKAQLTSGVACEVRGWAWGAKEIASVEVSTDGGNTWRFATLDPRKPNTHAWQGWRAEWIPPPPEAAGFVICCRATDKAGEVQPWTGARNEVFRLQVSVMPPAGQHAKYGGSAKL